MTNLILTNGRIHLEIEPQHGCIVRLAHLPLKIELVQEPRLAENFRLLLPLPHWRGHYLLGREQTLSDHTLTATHCTLTWRGLRSSAGDFDLTVIQTLHLDGDDLRVSLQVDNGTPYEVEEVFSLALGGLANVPERTAWRLHFPWAGGAGREWSFYEAFPGSYLGPPHPVWSAMYYGDLSMPWIDLYHSGERKGVYFGNHDPKIHQSCVWMQLFPSTVYRGGDWEQFWPDPALTGDAPVGLTLAWNSFPFLAPGQRWSGPPLVAHFHSGTWWAAADYYRAWFDTQVAIDKTGSWMTEADAWQSTIISYPDGTIGYRFCDLPQLAREALAIGIRVLQIDGWDLGGIDRDYPDYSPDPRLGTWDELAQAIADCAALGVRVMLFTNLHWVNLETEWYQRELHQYVVRDPRGLPRNAVGWGYNTTLEQRGQVHYRMVMANPARPAFRQIIVDQLLNTARLGAPGTQIDKVNLMGDFDYAPEAPGPRAGNLVRGVIETLLDFQAQARAFDPGFCIASEIFWDRGVRFLDAAYSRFFARDHLPTFAHTFPEYRPSCCITGDWDFGLVNNCLRFGHILNVEGRCLHNGAASVPTLGRYVAEALRVRRALWDVLWNSQLIEPTTAAVAAPPELLFSLHRSRVDGRQAVVFNHFERHALTATVGAGLDGASAQLWRPFVAPETVTLPVTVTVPPDEFLIVVSGKFTHQ